MAFWLILIKALKIKLAVSRLKRAKLNAYRNSKGLSPTYPWYEVIPRFIYRAGKYIFLRAFCWCLLIRGKNQKLSIWEALWTSGTLSNSLLISFAGLMCGLFFTHLITVFLIYQLNVSSYLATYGTMFFGIFFSLSLAFSETTRLFVFLTVPQFFTRKGRTAILTYAIILAVSGPGKNTTQNMEILTESIICTQEMAKNATAGLVRLVKDPLTAIGKAMRTVVDSVLEAADNIKNGLTKLMKLITSVVNTILFAFDWLKKIVEICNNKVGTPFDRCWKSFEEAIEDCHYQLGSLFSWMCNVVDLFQHICYVTKVVDLLCWLPSLVKDVVFKPIKKLLKNFMDSVKTFFDVRIPLPTYKFEHSLTPSKKFKEIIHDMKAEVTGELKWLLDYFDWMDFLVSIFLFLALYKAVIYRHRFLNMDRHDNFYITKGLVKLDWSRKRLGKQYIFPLAYRESRKFVQTYSFRMMKDEQKKLRNSVVLVTLGATQILNYMLLDFGLFLFLELLRRHGAIRVDTRNLLGYNIKIEGTGFMADMYRAILKALSPIGGLLPVFDTSPCLPIPSIPDYFRYAMLICLILFCYLATLTEPYLLRLRHIICGMYYPERKSHRDRWLYTHILSSRGTFASYARSQIKARLIGDKQVFRVSLWDRLSHTIPGFRFVVAYFSTKKKQCFLCGRKGDLDDFENFFQCPICHTIYCMECYNDVGKQCPAHNNLFDSSAEFSEEVPSDSSDDDRPKPLESVQKKPKKSVETRAILPRENRRKEPPREKEDKHQNKLDVKINEKYLSYSSESDDDRKPLLAKSISKSKPVKLKVTMSNTSSTTETHTSTPSKILKSVLPSIQGSAAKMKGIGSSFKNILKGKPKESELSKSKLLLKTQKEIHQNPWGLSDGNRSVSGAIIPREHKGKEPHRVKHKKQNDKLEEKTDESSLSYSSVSSESGDDRRTLLTKSASKSKPLKSRVTMPNTFSTGETDTSTVSRIMKTVLPSVQSSAAKMKGLGSNFKNILKGKSMESDLSKLLPEVQTQAEYQNTYVFDANRSVSRAIIPVQEDRGKEPTRDNEMNQNNKLEETDKNYSSYSSESDDDRTSLPTKSASKSKPVLKPGVTMPSTFATGDTDTNTSSRVLKAVLPSVHGSVAKTEKFDSKLEVNQKEKSNEAELSKLLPKTLEQVEHQNTQHVFDGNSTISPQNRDWSNFHVYSPQDSESEISLGPVPVEQKYLTSPIKSGTAVRTTGQTFTETISDMDNQYPSRISEFSGASSRRSQHRPTLDNLASCRISSSSNTPRKSSISSKHSSRYGCSPKYSPRKHVTFSRNGSCVEGDFDTDKAQISTGCDSRLNDFTESFSSSGETEPKSCCESAETDLNVYDEEIDTLDENGICHHHQSADDEVYDKYDSVVSEIESIYSQHSSDLTASDEIGSTSWESATATSTSTDDAVSESSKSHTRCGGHENVRNVVEITEGDQSSCNPVQNWVHRSAVQLTSSRNVAPGLGARVQQLDSFYLGMPYPPHSNIYKSDKL